MFTDVVNSCRPEQLSRKMNSVFSPSVSQAHLQAAAFSFDITMSYNNQTMPTSSPGTSSASLTYDAHTAEVSQKNSFMEMLSEIGMNGMVKSFCRWHGHQTDPERVKQMTVCVADLVDLILLQM